MKQNLPDSPTRSRRLIGAALILGAVLVALPAHATHEIDHRYTVIGTVSYKDGKPAPGALLELTVKGGKKLAEYKTDAQGAYRFVLHVHNQDLGKVFNLSAGGVTRKVKIKFNPNNRKQERGEKLDFVIERPPSE